MLPPGAYDPLTQQGWTASKSGLVWKFRGADPALPVTSARVQLLPKKGPQVRVRANGKRGSFATILPALPLHLRLPGRARRGTSPALMARACEICGKQRSVGHNVSHANNKTKRVWRPNLQRVRARVGGAARHLLVCTRCLRSGRVAKAV